jgi:ATP-dependent Clp protease ATP-binding subunit ClpC
VTARQPVDFDEAAARAIALADEEARRHSANFVGSYHLLLGLIAEGTGRAAGALGGAGLTLERTRAAAQARFGSGQSPSDAALGRTPRLKLALADAAEEAARLKSPRIETEHLLLALLREERGEGGAARVLRDLGVEADQVRSWLAGGHRGESQD